MFEAQKILETLTKRQKEVLEFLVNHERIKGYMPTMREVAEEFGVTHQAIDKIYKKLEKKEYISTKDNESRGVIVLKGIDNNVLQMAKEIESAYQLMKNGRITKEDYERIQKKVISSYLGK
ncbi:MAG: MarR family transcriptional regulator [Psychroserpens sp.]|nr:MarR family transcriptional regulator [Psychroserpens sp.]